MNIPNNLRISWLPSTGGDDWRAKRDAGVFSKWEKRQITSEQGATYIAKGNECRVSAQKFEANAIALGYYPRRPRIGLGFGTGTANGKSGESIHEVEPMQGYEIHRYFSKSNVPWSAIYVDGRELYSCERSEELRMIEYYYAHL